MGAETVATGILEQIWQGAIQPSASRESNRVRRILSAMIPTRLILLKSECECDLANVYLDDLELMPELAMGDVIVEELSIEVPYGTLIVLRREESTGDHFDPEAISFDIGVIVAKTLMTVLKLGAFSLDRENEALFVMACAYSRMAQTTGMQHLGLVPSEFSKGLAGTLGTYWSGAKLARTDRSGLFLDPNCFAGPDLMNYLLTLDPGFSAPGYHQLPNDLLVFSGHSFSFPEFIGAVQTAVNDMLGPRKVGMNWELIRLAKGI